jgi:hypothetical protein
VPTFVNISIGLVEQRAKRREREKYDFETQEYQNIGHCENVDKYQDIWPCTPGTS